MDLTLLITTYNRGGLLRQNLERLCQLTPPDEIIVVDDGGDDETASVCQDFEGRLPPIRYLYNDNPGPTICSLARNIGVQHASHDWIVTAEPELIYLTDVLAQFRELHTDYPNDVISAGSIYFAPQGYDPSTHERPIGGSEGIGWVAPYTALYKKEWIEAVGGWDEGFPGPWGWDDTDLLTRLRIDHHGQHIALPVEVVHQYHGLGADQGAINENYWLAKSFHGNEEDRSDVIANKGRPWGQLRTRSS